MKKISLCIPTWNRYEMLFESFANVINDERISEIVIVDDASDMDIYELVKQRSALNPKITLYRNLTNQDCYTNKMIAASYAENDFIILFDSDNILDTTYIDRLYDFEDWDEGTIYAPSFAKPTFDYTAFNGLIVTKENVADYMNEPMFTTCLNTANYFVNKKNYLSIWDGNIDPVTADSIFMAMNWLKAGNKIHIVEDLHYEHRVHPLSHYVNNNHRTGNLYNEIEQELKALS